MKPLTYLKPNQHVVDYLLMLGWYREANTITSLPGLNQLIQHTVLPVYHDMYHIGVVIHKVYV